MPRATPIIPSWDVRLRLNKRHATGKNQKAGSNPGLFYSGILRWQRIKPPGHKLCRYALSLSRTFEYPAVKRIELVDRREETKTGLLSNHDSCCFGTDFDDVGIRHIPDSMPVFWFLTRNNSERSKRFQPRFIRIHRSLCAAPDQSLTATHADSRSRRPL